MCKEKKEKGLGIKDLKLFNVALLDNGNGLVNDAKGIVETNNIVEIWLLGKSKKIINEWVCLDNIDMQAIVINEWEKCD